MNRFHIIANSGKDPEGTYTSLVAGKLRALGAESVTSGLTVPADADVILVLGGDGTMLRAAGDTFGTGIPLMGINIGTLGYLAETDMDDIDAALECLVRDEFSVENRMMLCGSADYMQDGCSIIDDDHCLNDVVITGCAALSLIRYDLFVNGNFLNAYAADGLIISTPTGSTGYNMSAGGPIVEPRAEIIVVTPICPHTLNTRSIVLSAEDKITVRIADSQKEPVAVQFDGREPLLLRAGETINVYKSEQITKVIKLREESFLNTLHKKLV